MSKLRCIVTLSLCVAMLTGCAAGSARDSAPQPAPLGDQVRAEEAKSHPPEPAASQQSELSEDVIYSVLLGEIAGQRGELPVATEEYLKAAKETRDPAVVERATRVAIYAKRNAEALEAARLWVEVAPEDLEARQVLAGLLVIEGKPQEALEHMRRIVASAQGGPLGGYLIAATMLGQLEDKAQALRLMGQLLAAEPPSAEGHYAYAILAAQSGSLDMAQAQIEKALGLRPDWAKARILQARILFDRGERSQGLEVLAAFVRSHPDNVAVRLTYARMLVEAKQNHLALEQFQELERAMPDNSEVVYAVALLSLHFKDLDTARQRFDQLLSHDKHEQEATFYLGQIEEMSGARQAALGYYERVPEGEFYLEARVRAAYLYGDLGQPQRAAELMQQLRNEFPDERVRLYLVEGEVLSETGRLEEAMAVYDRALEEFPDDNGLLYARGLLAEKLDRLDILERDLRHILKQDPNHPDALNALGYTLADRTSRYDEASVLIGRALELKPNDAAVIDSMGWLQFRLGNYAEAERYLRRALELLPDAEIAAHLGEVLWVMGDREAARAVWKEALERDPQSDILRKVMERLEP